MTPPRHAFHHCVPSAATFALPAALLLLQPAPATAQTFQTLYQFTGAADGAVPYRSPILGPDGSLYGTAQAGGTNCPDSFTPDIGCGTLWQLAGGTLTPLITFTGSANGAAPAVQLILRGKILYGSTLVGGTDNQGTLFTLQDSTQHYKLVHSFTGADGESDYAPAIFDSAGNEYGVTEYGGPGYDGTYGTGDGELFEIPRHGKFTVLHTFNGATDGKWPTHIVIDSSGNIFGGTDGGGRACKSAPKVGCGVIYTYSTSSQQFQVIYFSGGGASGFPPVVAAIDSSGNLYGKTRYGGGYDDGTLFELQNNGGAYTYAQLWDFTGGPDGAYPIAPPALRANGELVGVTSEGPKTQSSTGFGTLWQLKAGKFTTLYTFTGAGDGAYPEMEPVFDKNGNIYGSTVSGGIQPCNTPSGTLISPTGCGTVFEYTPK